MQDLDQDFDRVLDAEPGAGGHRRRATWITIATVGVLSASTLLAVPAIASSGDPAPAGRVVVCESGVQSDGDIQTSSAVATRAAPGDTTPLPDGCREG